MRTELRESLLFKSRNQQSSLALGPLLPVFPGGQPVDRIYLLAPASRGEDLAKRFGIGFNKHGAYFQIDTDVDLRTFPPNLLPFFARPTLTPFLSDITPTNSWGGSLGALLVSGSLQPIVESASVKFGRKCYVCGSPRWTDKSPAHQARTWWTFMEPCSQESFARQHLLALTPMCNDCEVMFSVGSDVSKDRLGASISRLASVFRFTSNEAEEYCDLVNRRRIQHSRHLWAADCSRVFADAPISIHASWIHRVEPGLEQPILYRPTDQARPANLLLCGVQYQLNDSHRLHFFK